MQELPEEEIYRLYFASLIRGVKVLSIFLVLAVLLGMAIQYLPAEPPGYYAVGIVLTVLMVFGGFMAFVLTRQCPCCGCRSPLTKKHSLRCRRCYTRLLR